MTPMTSTDQRIATLEAQVAGLIQTVRLIHTAMVNAYELDVETDRRLSAIERPMSLLLVDDSLPSAL